MIETRAIINKETAKRKKSETEGSSIEEISHQIEAEMRSMPYMNK